MKSKDLIASGELELYVAGLLSEERNAELSEIINNDSEVRKEVESIEEIVMHLAKEATTSGDQDFSQVLKKIVTQRVESKSAQDVKPSSANKSIKSIVLNPIIGWAVAATFVIFFIYQYQNTKQVQEILISNIEQKEALEQKIDDQIQDAQLKDALLKTVASVNTKKIDLTGQAISPQSNVSVFWNVEEGKVVIDASKLPEAPDTMVYQVWSLKLDPLTPTSLGLLENFSRDNTLFTFDNSNSSQAFGITLEPAGGSESPTLDQLYVLGAINS